MYSVLYNIQLFSLTATNMTQFIIAHDMAMKFAIAIGH
jgi:hypothetical protein